MKITPARADAFVRSPGADLIAILLYGPDQGLARERADAAVAAVAGTLNDPFLVTELQASDLRDDPARLMDEAGALAFGGGRRVVRLRTAADGHTRTLAETIEALGRGDGPVPALIVAEAGELGPRSSLRRLFEGAERAAAIACYLDEGQGLERVIEQTLAGHGLTPGADALAWLAAHLGADRRLTRNELEKLALYCADSGRVTIDDCEAVVGEAAAGDLEQAVYAAAGGELRALDHALARAFQEGTSPVAVIRAAQRHFQRLHRVAGAVAGGAALDAAMKTLRPPVFYKLADRFRAQARIWSPARAATALDLLTEAEMRCKSTGQPDRLIASRTLMQIAHAARAGRRAA